MYTHNNYSQFFFDKSSIHIECQWLEYLHTQLNNIEYNLPFRDVVVLLLLLPLPLLLLLLVLRICVVVDRDDR